VQVTVADPTVRDGDLDLHGTERRWLVRMTDQRLLGAQRREGRYQQGRAGLFGENAPRPHR
jgi:hypothetical protein